MKKKAYMMPAMQVVKIDNVQLLSGSGVTSENGIGFGGVDEGGTLDPSAPGLLNPSDPSGMLGLPSFVFQ
jgi:hypothetical protein